MKKIKILLYSAAFLLALSVSFAFKPAAPNFATAYLPAASCTTQTLICNSGSTLCTVGGVQAYTDKNTCQQTAFIRP